jgi:hypothetical protein
VLEPIEEISLIIYLPIRPSSKLPQTSNWSKAVLQSRKVPNIHEGVPSFPQWIGMGEHVSTRNGKKEWSGRTCLNQEWNGGVEWENKS